MGNKDKRYGRQTPTMAAVLPYETSLGGAAVSLYERSGFEALPWEKLIVEDMMAKDADGLWTHSRFCFSVPRQNGKNECVTIREMYGIVELKERILHTAQLATTAHKAWERLCDRLDSAKIEYESIKALGKESVTIEGGGRIEFRTRTSMGGMGETFDVLIIDEAQMYTPAQRSALQYTVAAAPNPQTIYLGTPPTPHSVGTVFPSLRADILGGKTERAAWEEWGIPEKPPGKDDLTICKDRELWYECNPSLGYTLLERTIADEIADDLNDFIIQRLGFWFNYSQTSAISKKTWLSLVPPEVPRFTGQLYFGIKYSRNADAGGTVTLAVAVKTSDGNVWVEAIDCRSRQEGDGWLLQYLQRADWRAVAVDGAQGEILEAEMKTAGMRKPIRTSVGNIVEANSLFEQGIYGDTIRHSGQPSLVNVVGNCDHRAIGSSGGFGYQTQIDGLDVTLIEAVSIAYWLAMTVKEKKPQSFSY